MARETPVHDAPEQISHRYHRIRVIVTLSTIGIVSMLIGLTALADPGNFHPLRYLAGCLFVAIVCGLAILYLTKLDGESTSSVEAAILVGLFATYGNTIYGGLLEVDPWWQVCGYLVVILVAGGVSLRRWPTFGFFIAIGLVAWTLAITSSDESSEFRFDSYVLILLGAVVAAAILWLFRIERQRVTELNRELQKSATHDALTGVLNRHGLISATGRDVSDGRQVWCVYVDVDYFKSINDLRGHDHGDEVLRSVASSMSLTAGERTARWGGDEFVTLGHGEPPDEAEIQEEINREIRKVEPSAGVTVGLATGQIGSEADLDLLLRRADRRMYARRAMARGEIPGES